MSFHSVRNSPIIWINGYQLMLLPRDLRLYMENMNRKSARSVVVMPSHSITPAPTTLPSLYVSGSLAASSVSLATQADPSLPTSLSPFSPRSVDSPYSLASPVASGTQSPTSIASSTSPRSTTAEERSSLFSPGPTFVDNIEDDMDDERMMVVLRVWREA